MFLVAGCDRGFTVNTFRFTRAMKAGDVVKRTDIEPISIPFASSDNTTYKETLTPEKAERVWITADEVDRYLGQPLVKDVGAGDQLAHKLFAPDIQTEP